jgi:hypothetical protein
VPQVIWFNPQQMHKHLIIHSVSDHNSQLYDIEFQELRGPFHSLRKKSTRGNPEVSQFLPKNHVSRLLTRILPSLFLNICN